MAYYRVMENLTVGNRIERMGTVIQLNMKAETIQKLVNLGAIAPLKTPPLSELDDYWQNKITKLKGIGVITAVDFLEKDNETLANTLKIKEPRINEIKQELINQWLQPLTIEKDCCG